MLDRRATAAYRCGMTVKLDLNPEVEAGLVAQDQARGLSLEEYLQQGLEGAQRDSSAHEKCQGELRPQACRMLR